MRASIRTAGHNVDVDSALNWAGEIINESHGTSQLLHDDVGSDIRVTIQNEPGAFDTTDWAPLTRDSWARDGRVVIRDVCTSGFDMEMTVTTKGPDFRFRWRPPPRTRALSYALRSRWHLLARAVLVQYPALWWAGVNDGVLMHAAVCTAGRSTPLIAGAAGVGKTTALMTELQRGEKAVSDNLCVVSDRTAWGLVEPVRVEGVSGRKMPHGRREIPLPNRVDSLVPDCVVILKQETDRSSGRPCEPSAAERTLVAGTYVAGELRRYWTYAATLALGTGLGNPHPPIAAMAADLTDRLPCFEIALSRTDETSLGALIDLASKDFSAEFRRQTAASQREDAV
jgi:hypothetical protein